MDRKIMADEPKPTEATIHWLLERWGYSPAHYSQCLPVAGGHDCNEKCYVIRDCSTITDEQVEAAADAYDTAWTAWWDEGNGLAARNPREAKLRVVREALEAARRVSEEQT